MIGVGKIGSVRLCTHLTVLRFLPLHFRRKIYENTISLQYNNSLQQTIFILLRAGMLFFVAMLLTRGSVYDPRIYAKSKYEVNKHLHFDSSVNI